MRSGRITNTDPLTFGSFLSALPFRFDSRKCRERKEVTELSLGRCLFTMLVAEIRADYFDLIIASENNYRYAPRSRRPRLTLSHHDSRHVSSISMRLGTRLAFFAPSTYSSRLHKAFPRRFSISIQLHDQQDKHNYSSFKCP